MRDKRPGGCTSTVAAAGHCQHFISLLCHFFRPQSRPGRFSCASEFTDEAVPPNEMFSAGDIGDTEVGVAGVLLGRLLLLAVTFIASGASSVLSSTTRWRSAAAPVPRRFHVGAMTVGRPRRGSRNRAIRLVARVYPAAWVAAALLVACFFGSFACRHLAFVVRSQARLKPTSQREC